MKNFTFKNPQNFLCKIVFLQIILLCVNVYAGDLRLADQQYIDPKGFFTIVPPDGWRKTEYPQDPRGKVAFLTSGDRVDLRVLVNAVDFSTLEDLVAYCQKVEKRLGMNTHIKRTTFGGRAAVQRTFTMKGSKFLYYDFLIGQVDHNLSYSAPVGSYEKFFPLISKSLETYEPVLKVVADDAGDQHVIAKKTRLAELMLETGNYGLAIHFAEEGLEVDPDNETLQQLRHRATTKFDGK